MKLADNFSLWEFDCRDGTPIPDEYMENVKKLAENLQVIRNKINQPMIIISGYRSPAYNKKIDGAKRSQHMLAKAADIVVSGMDTRELREIIIDLIKKIIYQ